MTTFNDFIKEWTGKFIDFDGKFGNTCVDLVQEYNKECIGGVPFGGNACDIIKMFDHTKYQVVYNTPTDVPLVGDVVVWSGWSSNPYGHCAIFVSGDVDQFTSFDQNWTIGTPPHIQTHNYSNVEGWLHPLETAAPTIPVPPLPTYTVQEGDTLGDIVQKHYGNIDLWSEDNGAVAKVAAFNHIVNANNITVGEQIILPPLS